MAVKLTEKWYYREVEYIRNHPKLDTEKYRSVWCPTCSWRLYDMCIGECSTCPKCRTRIYTDRNGRVQELGAEKRSA